MALTPQDLQGADSATRRFLQGLHEDALGTTDPQGQRTALNAGLNFLGNKTFADAYMPTPERLHGLAADRATDFGVDAQAAVNAIGAPAGSIAARNDPNRYGSIASREFKGAFGSGGAFDTQPLNDAVDQDPNVQGLARRALTQRFGGSGDGT